MDFEFSKGLYAQPVAKFSMGHEVIGHYFTDEVNNIRKIDALLALIEQVEQAKIYFKELETEEYNLNFNPRGVSIKRSILDDEFDHDLAEDSNYYDEESQAECGLEDFKLALLSWKEYIN